MKNLVGHTVRLSPQNKKKNGNDTRILEIIYEFYDANNVRCYNVQEPAADKNFAANADIYDRLFLRSKENILPKGTKDKFHNTSSADYKK